MQSLQWRKGRRRKNGWRTTPIHTHTPRHATQPRETHTTTPQGPWIVQTGACSPDQKCCDGTDGHPRTARPKTVLLLPLLCVMSALSCPQACSHTEHRWQTHRAHQLPPARGQWWLILHNERRGRPQRPLGPLQPTRGWQQRGACRNTERWERRRKKRPHRKKNRVCGGTDPVGPDAEEPIVGWSTSGVFPTPDVEAVPSAHAHRNVCALFLRVCRRLGYNRATVLAHLEFD